MYTSHPIYHSVHWCIVSSGFYLLDIFIFLQKSLSISLRNRGSVKSSVTHLQSTPSCSIWHADKGKINIHWAHEFKSLRSRARSKVNLNVHSSPLSIFSFCFLTNSVCPSIIGRWEQVPRQLSSRQSILHFSENVKIRCSRQPQSLTAFPDTQLPCMLVIQCTAYKSGIHR